MVYDGYDGYGGTGNWVRMIYGLKESNVSVVSYVMFYTMGMDPYACIWLISCVLTMVLMVNDGYACMGERGTEYADFGIWKGLYVFNISFVR